MGEGGLMTRRRAVELMTAVTEGGRLMAEVTGGLLAELSPAERARAQRLATEALRWAQRSDRVLGPYLRNRPEDPILNILRLAVFELFEAGEAPHGVVNDAVSLAKGPKSGLVNAVLRNVLRAHVDWTALPVPSVPKWLRKRLVAAWGKEAVAAMEAVFAAQTPLDLTVKEDAEGWAKRLDGELLPTGSVRLAKAGQVSALEGFDGGAWWVQDAAAAIPARVLDPKPGERVLDLCAAPGGKTMQMAATGATVTALDISPARMERLAENLARTGLSAECVTADVFEWSPPAPFDAILLDAPCSATGTLRRHPDLGYAKSDEGIAGLVALQDRMIDRALGWLKPGGRLVYCTCSLLPEEGEERAAAMASRHPDLVFVTPDASGLDPAWRIPLGLRIRPDHWAGRGGIDGFFVTMVQKPA